MHIANSEYLNWAGKVVSSELVETMSAAGHSASRVHRSQFRARCFRETGVSGGNTALGGGPVERDGLSGGNDTGAAARMTGRAGAGSAFGAIGVVSDCA
jgi:hypothetical protein